MKRYSKKDTNPMTYQEYGEAVNLLIKKIEKYSNEKKITFDVVAPILRSGGIPGNIIAIHLQVTRILPIQFKWFYKPKLVLKQLLSVPKIVGKVPKNPNILICENNTGSADTAKEAVKLIRKLFPNAKIFYSTVAKVFGSPNRLDNVEEYFFGIQTDENFIATEAEVKKHSLRKKITIFPWENVEHELEDINSTL